MRIGVPKETMPDELRVALTPGGAAELTAAGHEVYVQSGAGLGAGHPDERYERAGAQVVLDADRAWNEAELVVKVKEPLTHEYRLLRRDLTLFTYLHLAAVPELTEALIRARTTAIAYETVSDGYGGLPLLAPMSEIAGRLAALAGAHHLQRPHGGSGVLIGGVPGVRAANVVVIGGGIVGTNAARAACGIGASVTILERSLTAIRRLEERFDGKAQVLMATGELLLDCCRTADLTIGAVLVPGAEAPKLLRRADLTAFPPGAVLVDVAIDQGGCFETSRPTTHHEPVFVAEGLLHYCVANMPGAVPATATAALTNATLPYLRKLADLGVGDALEDEPGLRAGLNLAGGEIKHPAVATAFERASAEVA